MNDPKHGTREQGQPSAAELKNHFTSQLVASMVIVFGLLMFMDLQSFLILQFYLAVGSIQIGGKFKQLGVSILTMVQTVRQAFIFSAMQFLWPVMLPIMQERIEQMKSAQKDQG